MPISKTEFDQGQTVEPLESEVLSFLTNHRGSAFTLTEIIEEMKLKFAEDFWTVQTSLEALMKEGKVVGKIVTTPTGRRPYFIAT